MTDEARTSEPISVRKRPIVVQALLWSGGDSKPLERFCGRNWARADAVYEIGPNDDENVVIWNSKEEQWLNVSKGHWIIRGVDGELYPCAPDVFARTYEQV